MTDVERIVWGGLAGVVIFLLGQLISKFFIEPLYGLRMAIGEVQFNISFHAPVIHTPIGRSNHRSEVAYTALMSSSSNLIMRLHATPLYPMIRHLAFRSLPKKKAIEQSAIELRSLSTFLFEDGINNVETVNYKVSNILALLNLKEIEKDFKE